MTNRERAQPVVVGVDGSESALDAARWAADEAHRLAAPLLIVNVYTWPVTGYPETLIAGHDLLKALKRGSDEVLAQAREAALAVAPDLEVAVDSVPGDAVPRLRAHGERSSLIVVGSRGLGGFSGLLVGSVAVGLAGHVSCPVIVVRGEPNDGPVVVGLDGSPLSEAAIGFAFEEAAARGADLVAVHAWRDPGPDAQELLTRWLAGWPERYPTVAVTHATPRGRAAKVLMDHAQGARLLVIGSRGRGGFKGLILGSTSQALVHHAPCPVAVLHP